MKHVPLFTLAVALVATSAWAATDDQHAAHHAAGGASAPTAEIMPAKAYPSKARTDAQLAAMRALHDKMVAALTPGDRTALMTEHTKTMQDGMAMMKEMEAPRVAGKRGGMPEQHRTMEMRREMMQTMMELMMDRLPAGAAK